MRIDFTLTLPGLFEIQAIQDLAKELGVDVLAKVIFSFTPDIILSPLALPRSLLERQCDTLAQDLPPGALRDVLQQLRTRPTFEEQWPQQYHQALTRGKQRIQRLETIRQDRLTLEQILRENDNDIYAWWRSIPS
jgi:hypothetical protein